jgi:hypothetical protein
VCALLQVMHGDKGARCPGSLARPPLPPSPLPLSPSIFGSALTRSCTCVQIEETLEGGDDGEDNAFEDAFR